MALQLGLSAAHDDSLRIRRGRDRRRHNGGAPPDGSPDRRRGDRRRGGRFRHFLFTSFALALPHPLSSTHLQLPPRLAIVAPAVPAATVTASIDSFVAIPPWRAYDALIREAAAKYRLDAGLLRAVMQTESAFNPVAVSRAGALGLMQLMPDLAEELGVTDPFDPRQNTLAGARYLKSLLNLHEGDVTLAVASYNAGAGAVERYGGVPPFEETQNYVAQITQLIRRR